MDALDYKLDSLSNVHYIDALAHKLDSLSNMYFKVQLGSLVVFRL